MGGAWYNVKVRVAAGRLGGRCPAEKKIGEAQGTMGERYHVLVVDDDRQLCESAVASLKAIGVNAGRGQANEHIPLL